MIHAADLIQKTRIETPEDGLLHHARVPRDGLAVFVEPGPHANMGDRAEEPMLRVVLASPDNLHRAARGLGYLHGLGDEIRLAAAPETTAHVRPMDSDL